MDHLTTETRNPASSNLDRLTTREFVRLMCSEDRRVPEAVATQEELIAQAIDVIADRFQQGGRLVYVGAGTSGRLGVLDASECPPTFNSPPSQVVGVIAGGPVALTTAVEGAEDHPELAENDLQERNLSSKDVLVGIATSGRTPYVLGALRYARLVGAYAIGFACVADSELAQEADLTIAPVVGPEVLTGSTRLKAGTATKLVLNMLTTGAMVRTGKTYGNLMVDLRATNIKLQARSNRIVRQFLNIGIAEADQLLQSCNGELKTAITVGKTGLSVDEARGRLLAYGGRIREVIQDAPAHRYPDWIIGIDGGGTLTRAFLADRQGHVLGRGKAGPSNIKAGRMEALQQIPRAIEQAFTEAGHPTGPVGMIRLGLAGAGRLEDQQQIRVYLEKLNIAETIEVQTDVDLLFRALPHGWGIAVVAGTGSCVIGQGPNLKRVRSGGWGPLLGDEGSGYAIAMAALRAVAASADGRRPSTLLTARLLEAMELTQASQLIDALNQSHRWGRPQLAQLAPIVWKTARTGDGVAQSIVEHASQDLADCIRSVAQQLAMSDPAIAVTGGMIMIPEYQKLVIQKTNLSVSQLIPVEEPGLLAIR